MRAHQKHGYTSNDVSDYAFWGKGRSRPRNRISGVVASYLNQAAKLRARLRQDEAQRFRDGDYRTADDFKRMAADDVLKAREWRIELQGA